MPDRTPIIEEIRQRWEYLRDVPCKSMADYARFGEQAFADVGALLAALDSEPLGYAAGYYDIFTKRILVQADAEHAFESRAHANQYVVRLNELGEGAAGSADDWFVLEVRRPADA